MRITDPYAIARLFLEGGVSTIHWETALEGNADFKLICRDAAAFMHLRQWDRVEDLFLFYDKYKTYRSIPFRDTPIVLFPDLVFALRTPLIRESRIWQCVSPNMPCLYSISQIALLGSIGARLSSYRNGRFRVGLDELWPLLCP